jgi:hypothetical protein
VRRGGPSAYRKSEFILRIHGYRSVSRPSTLEPLITDSARPKMEAHPVKCLVESVARAHRKRDSNGSSTIADREGNAGFTVAGGGIAGVQRRIAEGTGCPRDVFLRPAGSCGVVRSTERKAQRLNIGRDIDDREGWGGSRP